MSPSLPGRWCCSLDSKLTSVQYGGDRGQLAAIPAEIFNFRRCDSRLAGKGRSGPRSAVQHGIRSPFPLGSHRDHHCGITCTRQDVGLTRPAYNVFDKLIWFNVRHMSVALARYLRWYASVRKLEGFVSLSFVRSLELTVGTGSESKPESSTSETIDGLLFPLGRICPMTISL